MKSIDEAIKTLDSKYVIKRIPSDSGLNSHGYAVYKDGRFICSCDNEREAEKEIEKDKEADKPKKYTISYENSMGNASYESILAKNENEAEKIGKKKHGKMFIRIVKDSDTIKKEDGSNMRSIDKAIKSLDAKFGTHRITYIDPDGERIVQTIKGTPDDVNKRVKELKDHDCKIVRTENYINWKDSKTVDQAIKNIDSASKYREYMDKARSAPYSKEKLKELEKEVSGLDSKGLLSEQEAEKIYEYINNKMKASK